MMPPGMRVYGLLEDVAQLCCVMCRIVAVPQSQSYGMRNRDRSSVDGSGQTIRQTPFIIVGEQVAADSVIDTFRESAARAGDCRNSARYSLNGSEAERLGPNGGRDECPSAAESSLYLAERDSAIEPNRPADPQFIRKCLERCSSLPITEDPQSRGWTGTHDPGERPKKQVNPLLGI